MNRLVRPVQFAFEADVVFQFSRLIFGAAGAVSLDTNNSKGACNIALNVISITGNTTSTSTTISSVSSFAGLYVGMAVTGAGVGTNAVISSMNPGAGTMVLSVASTATASGVALSVSGGQYALTLGSQFTPFKRLDTYTKLLDIDVSFDETGVQGGATTGALAPAAPDFFLVQNNVKNAQLASVVIQFGYYTGSTFTAASPASGEVAEVALCLSRSSTI